MEGVRQSAGIVFPGNESDLAAIFGRPEYRLQQRRTKAIQSPGAPVQWTEQRVVGKQRANLCGVW